MNDAYLWIVTAITAAVAGNTLFRLVVDRQRLFVDDLQDEDRLFAWRIVLFLIYPLMTLIDLRSTLVTCHSLGGFVKDWSYGLFWYHAVPQGLASTNDLLCVLFAGVGVQMLVCLTLLCALLFRPHPFVSCILGYSIISVLALNCIVDPLLSMTGLGGWRWHAAWQIATPEQRMYIFAGDAIFSLVFILVISNRRTRQWFAHLSSPVVAESLVDAELLFRTKPENAYVNARLALLYEKAGMRGQALKQWKRLQYLYPESMYSTFVEAILAYRQRKYKQSRGLFLITADLSDFDALTRGCLLAAAGCAAFAEGDLEGALNLSERALEFDDASLVARMVKVDVFLRTGRKEQAGDEIIAAMRRGLDLDLTGKVPVDSEYLLHRIDRFHATSVRRELVNTQSK